MLRDRSNPNIGNRLIYGVIVAIVLPACAWAQVADEEIDLDGSMVNGAESRVETKVLSTFPAVVENTVFNNAPGMGFDFDWPGAGLGGFQSFVTPGPDVGTVWHWESSEQIYNILSPITFTPARGLPVVGMPPIGIQIPGNTDLVFTVPGKSTSETQVTLSTTDLTASLITFFSPEETRASCGVDCDDFGVCTFFVENLGNAPIGTTVQEQECCNEENQIICENGECKDYLVDPTNCGGCGVQCGPEEFCDQGVCVCPTGETQCGTGCFDLLNDPNNCGVCDNQCGSDQFCNQGECACSDPNLTICSGVCEDLQNDVNNCGACGNQCEYDEYCGDGICEPICPGQTYCPETETCVDIESDPLNCGACGNVCGSNDICTEGACFTCRNPLGTACDNVCTNIHKDPLNCGGCGNVCDFSGCPSEGQGACSMGSSCICSPGGGGGGDSTDAWMSFEPTPTFRPRVERPRVGSLRKTSTDLERRSAAIRSNRISPSDFTEGSPRRASRSRLDDRTLTSAGARPRPRQEVAGASSIDTLEPAPVCVVQVEQQIPAGGMLTETLETARFGFEKAAVATIEANGQLTTGPCPVIIPATEADTQGVVVAPVRVDVTDSSGDNLCASNDVLCHFFFTVVGVGDMECTSPVVTMSADPSDVHNLNAVTFFNDTAGFSTLPGYPGDGVPLEQKTNDVAFALSLGSEQAPNVSRPFLLTFDCMDETDTVAVMPISLGIGGACDPATDIDGQTYDGLQGLDSPVDAALVAQGSPVNYSTGNFNHGSTIPMKLDLFCGSQLLGGADLDPHPEIVSLVHETLGPQTLDGINGDNNANPDDPFLSCTDTGCDYQYRTEGKPSGTYVIAIRMPDSRVFEAGFTVRP
jgi:hypothetical protein